jgi:hypothetical protein
MNSAVVNPSGGCGDRLEVSPAIFNKVREDLRPVIATVPGNLRRGVNLDRHNLGRCATFDDDDKRADATILTAPFLPALNVSYDERIPYVGSRNYMCRYNGEPTVGFRMIPIVQLNEKSALPNVGRNTLELESLESGPA